MNSPLICPVAGALLVHDQKIMLVKHKKLGIWLAPGGHLETGELPHQAAERECFEETGISVKAINPFPTIADDETTYYPVPVFSNIHWISKENYQRRLETGQPTRTNIYPRGCEQHYIQAYLVQPIDSLAYQLDPAESTDIGWFSLEEIESLETRPTVKQEMRLAFEIAAKFGITN